MSILINGLDMPSDDGELVEVLIFGDGHVVQTGDSFKAEDGRFYYKPCDWKYLTAVPVKPGTWEWNTNNGFYYCSNCQTVSPREDQYGEYCDCPNYCPNCGAKMDGGKDDE